MHDRGRVMIETDRMIGNEGAHGRRSHALLALGEDVHRRRRQHDYHPRPMG